MIRKRLSMGCALLFIVGSTGLAWAGTPETAGTTHRMETLEIGGFAAPNDGGVLLARGGHGPGDGTGNGGSGPRDGSGNGKKSGDCVNDAVQAVDSLLARGGNGQGGHGPGDGTGNGSKSGDCSALGIG